MASTKFSPDWNLPPPSTTILDLLCKKGISVVDFDEAAKLNSVSLSEVINGSLAIDRQMAFLLEEHLGGSAIFWINREHQYRSSLSSGPKDSLSEYLLGALPIRDMNALGWLTPFRRHDSDIDAAIRFFNVSSKEQFIERYGSIAHCLNFRKSNRFDMEAGSLAAWMRAAEIQAEKISCREWHKEKLIRSIEDVKRLTWIRDPNEFLPLLKEICSEAGVALSVVRTPRGCPASGAARFLSPKNAMIVLSFRHLTDDHFWFSFFHEVGHLVLHNQNETFIDLDETHHDKLEVEANEFASSIIIPPELIPAFDLLSANKYEIVRFARMAGISPGLIVGQMQYRKKLRYNQMNRLKRRFEWDS